VVLVLRRVLGLVRVRVRVLVLAPVPVPPPRLLPWRA
jgi:hypothetical protein